MIFKQIDEILSGQKTQTRRVVKPEDFYEVDCDDPFCDTPDYHMITVAYRIGEMTRTGIKSRRRWQVGHTYAVVPKRGMPGVWWTDQYGISGEILTPKSRRLLSEAKYPISRLVEKGWHPLRIRITAIRQERLQDITEADARAEGVADVAAYRALWEKINTRKGTRWTDNPMVFVLGFELVRREHNA